MCGLDRYGVPMGIDKDAPEWPREQIAATLRARIESRELGPRLPSVPDLSAEFGVSPMTVQKALDMLKADGLIYAVPGRGTFVK
jgi:DNA-binding GntR family transcriptional regulator